MSMNILNFFKPEPNIAPIKDPKQIGEDYRYWRIRILYSMFIGYALYYFTRKSFTFAMPGLIQEMGMTKSQLGFLGSVLSISYGISKFASGVLSDRSNPRFFMAFGLLMTGVVNICFGLSSSLFLFALFWGLNGWFQGFGAPPCAHFLTHWYSHSERGGWWSIWNVSHNVGAFIIPWIVGICLHLAGWRWAMYVPGILCILGGFYLANRLRSTPQSIGLPPIEQFRDDLPPGVTSAEMERKLTTKEILWDHLITNPYLWMLAFSFLFVYVVRTGINDWTALFLLEKKGYGRLGANGCVSLFEVGGFFGSLSAGWLSDRLFSARRGPVNALFAAMMLVAISLFRLVPPGFAWLDSALMFLIGFAIFGPQLLIGVAAVELSHKKAAASATGFVGCFAYIGAALAGYPIGKMTDLLGWNGFFIAMTSCSLISLLLLVPLWNITANTRKAAPKPRTAKTQEEYA